MWSTFNTIFPIDFQVGDYVDLRGVLDASMGGKLAKIYQIVDIPYPTYKRELFLQLILTLTFQVENKDALSTPRSTETGSVLIPTASLDVQIWVYSFAI